MRFVCHAYQLPSFSRFSIPFGIFIPCRSSVADLSCLWMFSVFCDFRIRGHSSAVHFRDFHTSRSMILRCKNPNFIENKIWLISDFYHAQSMMFTDFKAYRKSKKGEIQKTSQN